MLDAQPPDVMLLDLGLPDINGVEVIRYAAARHPRCDVLVVTMFGDDQHVLASIEAGATGYLLKDAQAEHIAASHPRVACRRLADQPGHRAPGAGALPGRRQCGPSQARARRAAAPPPASAAEARRR